MLKVGHIMSKAFLKSLTFSCIEILTHFISFINKIFCFALHEYRSYLLITTNISKLGLLKSFTTLGQAEQSVTWGRNSFITLTDEGPNKLMFIFSNIYRPCIIREWKYSSLPLEWSEMKWIRLKDKHLWLQLIMPTVMRQEKKLNDTGTLVSRTTASLRTAAPLTLWWNRWWLYTEPKIDF